MIEHLKDKINYISLAQKEVSRINSNQEWNNQVIITWIAIVGSMIMSVMNILQHSYLMLCATGGCVLLLTMSYLLAKPKKKTVILKIVFVVIFIIAFTFYTIIGGNDGFATLWLILAPYVLMVIIDLKMGLLASIYYLVMLILLFNGPLHFCLQYQYSKMFITRFPALYAINATFALSFAIRIKNYQYKILQDKETLEKLAKMDISVGLMNRNSYNEFVKNFNNEKYKMISAMYIDINGLHEVNNRHGHNAGDEMIETIANICLSMFEYQSIYRIGGDEFLIISSSLDLSEMTNKANKIAKQVEKCGYSISYGVATQNNDIDILELVSWADKRMLENKESYYKSATHNRRKIR